MSAAGPPLAALLGVLLTCCAGTTPTVERFDDDRTLATAVAERFAPTLVPVEGRTPSRHSALSSGGETAVWYDAERGALAYYRVSSGASGTIAGPGPGTGRVRVLFEPHGRSVVVLDRSKGAEGGHRHRLGVWRLALDPSPPVATLEASLTLDTRSSYLRASFEERAGIWLIDGPDGPLRFTRDGGPAEVLDAPARPDVEGTPYEVPGGRLVLTTSHERGGAVLYRREADGLRERGFIPLDYAYMAEVAFSPDGRLVAFASRDELQIHRLFDDGRAALLRRVARDAHLSRVEVTDDGTEVRVLTSDGTLERHRVAIAPLRFEVAGESGVWEPPPAPGPAGEVPRLVADVEVHDDDAGTPRELLIQIRNAGPVAAYQLVADLRVERVGGDPVTRRAFIGTLSVGASTTRTIALESPPPPPTRWTVTVRGADRADARPLRWLRLPQTAFTDAEYQALARRIVDESLAVVRELLDRPEIDVALTPGSSATLGFAPAFGITYQNAILMGPGVRSLNRTLVRARTEAELGGWLETMLWWYLPHELLHNVGSGAGSFRSELEANLVQPALSAEILRRMEDPPLSPEAMGWVYEHVVELLAPYVSPERRRAIERFVLSGGRGAPWDESSGDVMAHDTLAYVYFGAVINRHAQNSGGTLAERFAAHFGDLRRSCRPGMLGDGVGCEPAEGLPRVTAAAPPADGDWIGLPGGTFSMGVPAGRTALAVGRNERPAREVTLSPFSLTRTEVTVDAYASCVAAGACTPAASDGDDACNSGRDGRGGHPVNCVTWEQARTYCRWAGGRLLSEAEWEYAARSGGQPRWWPWGNEAARCDRARFNLDEIGRGGCGPGGTAVPCAFPEGHGDQGICDLAGNVAEWVADRAGPYPEGPEKDPRGPATGDERVTRGGAWRWGADRTRATSRVPMKPTSAEAWLGFRCARTGD